MPSTARLRLEPIGPALAHDLWLLYQDPGVAAWFDGPWSRSPIAYDRTSGALVGRGGPSVTDVPGGRHVGIGWAVRRECRGRGHATEIGTAAPSALDALARGQRGLVAGP